MMKNVRIMTPFGLYTFFYLVLELAVNDYAAYVVGNEKVTLLYGVCYLAVALGYPMYYFLRKGCGESFMSRMILVVCGMLSGAAFLCLSITKTEVLFVMCTLLLHLVSGLIGGAVYFFTAMRLRSTEKVGIMVGLSYAAANILQIIGLLLLSLLSIPLGRVVERIAILAAIPILLWLIFKEYTYKGEKGINKKEKDIRKREKGIIKSKEYPSLKDRKTSPYLRKYIVGGLCAMALLAVMHGMNDGIITSLHAGGGEYIVYGIPRLFVIPGLIVAGLVADIRNRKFFPYATLLSMMIITTAILLFSSPDTYNIATGFIYFFGSFMSLFSVLPFLEWAAETKRPALVAVLGRSVRYGCSGIAISVSGYLFASVDLTILLIVYVVLLAGLFTVFFMMGQLRLPTKRMEEGLQAEQSIAREFSLTERESEILALLIKGQTTAEIAGALFISDKTVRNHISNMLIKTKQHSRSELLILVSDMKKRSDI